MTDVPRLLGSRFEVGRSSAAAGWPRSTSASTPASAARSPSRSCAPISPATRAFLSRFRREAQSAAGLNHAAIVSLRLRGRTTSWSSAAPRSRCPHRHGVRQGADPARGAQRTRPLSANEACRITEGVLDALSYSHRMGIVHRGHQARQRHDRRRRRGQGHGLRHRPGHRGRQRDDDPDPGRHRHGAVPLPRAGPGQTVSTPVPGHLLHGLHAL